MKIEFKILILLVSALGIFGCKKQGCMDEFALNYDLSAKKEDNRLCIYKNPKVEEYVPNYGANTATLVAIDRGFKYENNKYGPELESWMFSLFAGFSLNGENLVSAGDVSMSVYSQQPVTPYFKYFMLLNKNSNNYYSKIHTNQVFAPPSYFPNPIEWQATGDNWPVFNTSTSSGFSGKSSVKSENPSVSSPYTFQVVPMANADSLVLEIIGQRKHIIKVIPSNKSSHVFSQQEIESVGRGNAILRVVSVKYRKQIEGEKTYYMLNQKRTTKEVFIE